MSIVNIMNRRDLPSLPDGAGTVERCGRRARLLGPVRRVVHALRVLLVADGRRQRHAVVIRHLQQHGATLFTTPAKHYYITHTTNV